MRVVLVWALFSGLLCSSLGYAQAKPHSASANAVNHAVYNIPITMLDGSQSSLREAANGRAIYLKLWASWCQSCLQGMPHLQHTYQHYNDKLAVIAINVWMNESMAAVEKVIERYALTVPVAMDTDGKIAQAFNLFGTPMHILINSAGNIIHKGHAANEELDAKLSLLASGRLPSQSLTVIAQPESSALLDALQQQLQQQDKVAVLFTSTWCDWYLEDSRPAMSRNCQRAQKMVNSLQASLPAWQWQTMVSRLWTEQKELDSYKEKYNILMPAKIDATNQVFNQYAIKHFPTLLMFKQGKEVLRIEAFDKQQLVQQQIQQL